MTSAKANLERSNDSLSRSLNWQTLHSLATMENYVGREGAHGTSSVACLNE